MDHCADSALIRIGLTTSLPTVSMDVDSLINDGWAAPIEVAEHLGCQLQRQSTYLARRSHAHVNVEMPVRDSSTSQVDSRG